MDVIFYKTKLSRQNRCYDINAYNAYLSTRQQKTITLSHEIIPNNPFYIETDEAMWDYNYITYTYRGYIFGAFIDSIRIQAISGSTQIIHTTDNWYFTLRNIGIENIDFHGQCVRAHVNDVVQKGTNHYATLQNTTSSPEEIFNEANCIQFLKEPTYSWTYDKDIYWLYIYIANPGDLGLSTWPFALPQAITYPYGNRKVVSNTGITLCYYLIPEISENGLPAPYVYARDSIESNYKIVKKRLEEFTYGAITSMLVTKIPPRGDIVGVTRANLYPSSVMAEMAITSGSESYDFPLNFITTWTPSEFKFSDDTNYSLTLFADDNLPHLISAEDFRTWGCYKLHTSIYNPLRFGDNFINTLSCNKNDSFYFSLTFDLTQSVLFNPSENYSGLQGITLRNNSLVFAPNAVNDYWTRLNALQTSIAGQITENKGIIQGINNNYGIAKASISAAGGVINTLKNIGNSDAISAGFSAVESAVDVANQLQTYGHRQENAQLTTQSGQIIQEIAAQQYRAGTTTNRAISYFALPSCDESALISGVWNVANFEAISKNLHRYGYNTFLQLDDIYFNHKRENFNYIKAADCEVVGVPTDVAIDLENMFLNGVHLWSGQVENFDVVNYQEGLTW